MSGLDNPFDPNIKLTNGCTCGRHSSQEEHERAPKERMPESVAQWKAPLYEHCYPKTIPAAPS